MKVENKKKIDEYFDALCDENFTDWQRFDHLLQQLSAEDKPYFLEKWKQTTPIRQAVELLKEGGAERLENELKKQFGISA